RIIEARLRRNELVAVAIDGAGKQEHWARPQSLQREEQGAQPALVHILSPFDPLIIQRKRSELIFGYSHKFEAYVPRAKRVFGY
ncbi:crosslink repair DNA glycosylase YcaQ family protein, partial [Acinetobacter baumannii]